VHVPWSGLRGGEVELRSDDGAALRVGFDHARIVGTTVQRLRGKIDYAPVGFELLPAQFTLLDLQQVHEAVLGESLNKDSFRRRLLASGQLQATGRRRSDVGHRPPELFRFRAARGGRGRTTRGS
jgi:8-oxo-dGTP diphosphatase